jgi:hypothetical protein
LINSSPATQDEGDDGRFLQRLVQLTKKSNLGRLVYLSVLSLAGLAIPFSIGCSSLGPGVARTGSIQENRTVSSNSPVTSPAPAAVNNTAEPGSLRSVRDVDFKNFTYPWYPTLLKAPAKVRELPLRDGKFKVWDQKAGIAYLNLSLENVSYVNLLGGSQEQAIVTVAGVETFNSFTGSIFIYTLQNQQLRLLWQHQVGDRANDGLRRIAVEGGELIVEQYDEAESHGLCCPTMFIRTNYKWNGRKFQKVKSTTLKSESDTAEFLGYPNE